MPRAFLVKKTRGAYVEKFRTDYVPDYLDDVCPKQTPNDKDKEVKDSTLLEQRAAFREDVWHIHPTPIRHCSYKPHSDNHVDTPEPMDLSKVNPLLRVSSTSAFEHVGPMLRRALLDDPPPRPNEPTHHEQLDPAEGQLYGHEPLDLHIGAGGSRRSPYSCGSSSPEDRPAPPTTLTYNDAISTHHEEVPGPPVASALHSVDQSSSNPTGLQDVGAPFSQYGPPTWINAASSATSSPYYKQRRLSLLASDTPGSITQDPFDRSSGYNEYAFPSDIDAHDYKMPMSSQKPTDLSSDRESVLVAPYMPQTDRFLMKQVPPLRRMEFSKGRSINQPRQPVLGLEYVQNMPNSKDIDTSKDDSNEFKDFDIQETDLSAKPEPGLSPTLPPNPSPIEAVSMNNHDSLSSPEKPPKSTQLKKYMCDVCGKGFSRSNTLVTHKRIHTGDKPFKCELCGRAFRQPGNLTRHRLTHTTVKPYICQQCGKAFNRASNLHTHMRTHTNYKPFVCQYCGKGFHQKIDMKIHSYTHTGEKPHKCKKCGRGFKQLTHLTYHMRTHSDIKMYTCAYCGKGFNQKGNLQAHIYGHTGERPYHCEICNKGFTLASTLNTHRRTHADKKPYDCQYCGKDFYQKNALKSHMIASHPYTGKCLL